MVHLLKHEIVKILDESACDPSCSGHLKGLNSSYFILHSPFSMSHASCFMPFAPCLMLHVPCSMSHAPCLMLHASCSILNSAFSMLHSLFFIHVYVPISLILSLFSSSCIHFRIFVVPCVFFFFSVLPPSSLHLSLSLFFPSFISITHYFILISSIFMCYFLFISFVLSLYPSYFFISELGLKKSAFKQNCG